MKPGEFLKSDDAYLAAERGRDKRLKALHAGAFTIIGTWLLFVACIVGYICDGIRGVIGAPLAFGMLIAGLMQFEKWLAKKL